MKKENSLSRRHFLLRNAAVTASLGLAPELLFGTSRAEINASGTFTDHGVASPIGQHRGIAATTDGAGRDVVLLWLFDHRGGYALLMIDAETGRSEQFDMPFPPGDAPYASILSGKNKFYTLFKGYFVEFDPAERKFTFQQKTSGAAMSMTEDDNGLIWAATYPGSGLVSFDPSTRIFTDYGFVNKENWAQYQRSIAADDKGWIYFSIGYTSSQIVCFNPADRETRLVFAEKDRKQGSASLYRNKDGKVYGKSLESDENGWLALYGGMAAPVGSHSPDPVKYIADSQNLFHRAFKSGRKIVDLDLTTNTLKIADPSGDTREVKFTHQSEGAIVMGVALAPDKTICGGTAFPMRQFSFNPKNRQWTNLAAYGQFNTVESDGKHFYVGGYPGGFLLRWDPAKPYKATAKELQGDCNPAFLGEARPDVYRPFRILVHPDNRTIIYSGGPAYGLTGGGMVFWDKTNNTMSVLSDKDLVPDQSTMSLAALGTGLLAGGTTTAPGTGGEKKANEALFYLLDERSKKIIWQEALFPGAQGYNDLIPLPDGNVAGFADRKDFFVFDPKTKKVIRKTDIEKELALGKTVLEQGPRIFVRGDKGRIYIVLQKGIAELDPKTYGIRLLGEAPQPIRAGGAYLDGAVYFVCESHLWSFTV